MTSAPDPIELPDGLVHARTTDIWDETTVPAGLLRAHRVAEGVWGRLVVLTGEVGFVFEDQPDQVRQVGAGEHQVIPPLRAHHVVLAGPARFAVEFHRPAE